MIGDILQEIGLTQRKSELFKYRKGNPNISPFINLNYIIK